MYPMTVVTGMTGPYTKKRISVMTPESRLGYTEAGDLPDCRGVQLSRGGKFTAGDTP